MRKTIVIAGLVGLLLNMGMVTHANQGQEDPCANAQTQVEMNECYGRQAKIADAELNAIYQKLMSVIDQTNKERLKAAELAWIKFRDANCAFVAAPNEGGSVYPTAVSVCIGDMTQKRTNELRAILVERSAR